MGLIWLWDEKRDGSGWGCGGCVHTHSQGFSNLALLQGVPLAISAPKHKVNLGPQAEKQNFCSVWSPWRGAPVLLSLCCGSCQHSLPCRPLVCCKLLAAHERLGMPFSLLYLHIALHQSHVCQFSCNWALVLCMGSFLLSDFLFQRLIPLNCGNLMTCNQ